MVALISKLWMSRRTVSHQVTTTSLSLPCGCLPHSLSQLPLNERDAFNFLFDPRSELGPTSLQGSASIAYGDAMCVFLCPRNTTQLPGIVGGETMAIHCIFWLRLNWRILSVTGSAEGLCKQNSTLTCFCARK